MPDPNLASFRHSGLVSYYRQLQQLQPAEKAIFQQFSTQFPQMQLLDLGVGAGRTTHYLADRVLDYIGVDYSPEMIEACKQRFSSRGERIRFRVGDARDLDDYPDHAFDFILFSFNGIDNMTHAERLAFLKSVLRIGKSGGYFCFSTHNLQGIEKAFCLKTQLSLNPVKTYVNGIMWGFLRWFNRPLDKETISAASHAVIRDESHNFRLRQYYIRPKAQLEQLSPFFSETTVYSWQRGEAIAEQDLEHQQDMWLYYLCKIP